jgi:hypothetical protein
MEWNEKAVTPLLADRLRQMRVDKKSCIILRKLKISTIQLMLILLYPTPPAVATTPWKMDLIEY